MRFLFYQDDYLSRKSWLSTEDSVIAALHWLDATCKYASEDSAQPEGCRNIVAERILFRSIVGIPDLEVDSFRDAYPFGGNGPLLKDVMCNGVKCAVAFIPLIQEGVQEEPILARLYCVAGMNRNFACKLQDADEPVLSTYNWFLSGIPENMTCLRVDGRSWMLAAHLLMNAIKSPDNIRRNLASHYIVTGDVLNGNIRQVEIGCKAELAKDDAYKNFKWIVAMKNRTEMEAAGMSARIIETPSNLEEALKLIETMQNKATRSFFRFLKSGNLEGMKEQREIGADLYAVDVETGSSTMALVSDAINRVASDSEKTEKFRKIRTWLRAEGADPMMMYYLLAKYGLDDALRQCLRYWPIDARNEYGYNATEFALLNGEFELAKKLKVLGCSYGANNIDSTLKSAIASCFHLVFSFVKEDELMIRKCRELLKTAIQLGLSPDNIIDGPSYKTTIFGLALFRCDIEMIDLCLTTGADPSKEIEINHLRTIEGPDGEDMTYWEKDESSGTPLYVVNFSSDTQGCTARISSEQREAAIRLLLNNGAVRDERVTRRLFAQAVATLGSKQDSEENRGRVLEYLGNGFSYEEQKDVFYYSADDASKREKLRTTLWGWSVYNGDLEVMRKCLEMGVDINAPLQFSHIESNHLADLQYLNKCTPAEVILMSEDIPLDQQMAAYALLMEHGLVENSYPRELLNNRHDEELGRLNRPDDVKENRTIDVGSYNNEEPALTDVFGKSLWYGWIDVMERCLLLGASARNVIHYRGWFGTPDGSTYDLMSATPRELLDKKKDMPSWLRNRALKLLAKFENR